MRNRRRNWFFRRIVLGFAVLALVVPAVAQARVDESTIGQPNSSQQAVKGVRVGLPVISQARIAAREGDLYENARLAPRSVSRPQVVSSAGFDWSAGIGAGLALGLVLVAGAALVAARHLGRPQTA